MVVSKITSLNLQMEKCPSMAALKERTNLFNDGAHSGRTLRDISPISICSQVGVALPTMSNDDDFADKILLLQDKVVKLETQFSKLESEIDQMKPLKRLS